MPHFGMKANTWMSLGVTAIVAMISKCIKVPSCCPHRTVLYSL
jgi:hypothetical protein